MARLLCGVCALFFLLTPLPQNIHFLKYQAVEAYELQPGILMFPKYAADGKVCEIGVERRHYSPGKIVLYSLLSRQEIDAIVDELAPASERGARSGGLTDGLSSIMGRGMTTVEDYDNVSVQIHSQLVGNSLEISAVDNVVVIISWKNRPCK
jgi:hypothetical protein